MSTDMVNCVDVVYPVDPKNIQIINFDKNCVNGQNQEIKVRLYGPSSDDQHQIIGFDKKGKLVKLIEDVYIQSHQKISDSIIKFTSSYRCDRIGTEFCLNEYHFNSVSRQVKKITQPEYKHTRNFNAINDSVKVYVSPTAAEREIADSVLYVVPPNAQVSISHFLDKNSYYLIQYEEQEGWITYKGLYKFNVSFAD